MSIAYCLLTNAPLRKIKSRLKVRHLPCFPKATKKIIEFIYLRSQEILRTTCSPLWRITSRLNRSLKLTVGNIELARNFSIGEPSLMEGENLISINYVRTILKSLLEFLTHLQYLISIETRGTSMSSRRGLITCTENMLKNHLI